MAPVKFLSDEWARQLKDGLNANTVFTDAIAGQRASIQQVIADPDGETHYWIRIEDGAIDMGIGDTDAPDATITQDRDTAVGMARAEVNPVSAFMTGKLRITGNLMLLMGLQTALGQLPVVMQEMDVDY